MAEQKRKAGNVSPAAEDLCVEENKEGKQPEFTKEQIMQSGLFQRHKDALSVLLTDSRRYTKDEAEKIIKEFQERKVN